VTRRSVDSVNARWGNLRAILAGDFLLARASEIAASLGVEVAGLLGHTIGRLCEGEIGQLRSTFDPTRTKDAYLSSIRGKTASLFATSCRIGGIVADMDRSHIEAVSSYGQAFGMVFQIADDVLDLTASEEELGKPSGHDLVEGVYTLPVIFTLGAGGAPAEELGELLGRPIQGPELDKALSIVRSGPGVAKAITVGRHYADIARDALAALPPTPTSDAMAAAPHALLDTLRP
jgi:heptaprenyl diphosphate synthase